MRIISFIDQPDVIKKILQHLGLWEESHAPAGQKPRTTRDHFWPLLLPDRLTLSYPKLPGDVQPYLRADQLDLFPSWERCKLPHEGYLAKNTETVLEKTSGCGKALTSMVC